MTQLPDPLAHRQAEHPVDSLFVKRWSPRAMSGESLDQQTLLTLFEAARWAPSSYNEQEWRFVYAHRDTEHWPTFFNFLVEGNQAWCHRAAVLVVVCSRRFFSRNNKPNKVHSFDTGAAFQNLALQGSLSGLVVHGMIGFNESKVRHELKVPEEYQIEAMIAIGKPGNPADLGADLHSREVPSGRKPVSEFISEGLFKF